jgi:hypothetical protein
MKFNWQKFKEDPFSYVDGINLKIKGKYDFNLFHDDMGVRRLALRSAIVALGLWIIFGFDSTPLQFLNVITDGIPGLIAGHLNWSDLLEIFNNSYGKEMHYSAYVCYALLFWAVSKNWASVGVLKSRNVIYSFGIMFLAIGIFEWFWIGSFGVFQQQPWVYTWQMPQLRILFQNLSFTIAGGLAALYMLADSYKFVNHEFLGRLWLFPWKSKKLWLSVGVSVAAAVFWIYYPGSVEQFSVVLKNGQIWESSRLFPQTLYTINLDPGSSVNAGVWFYYENNWIHAVNTGVKFLWALSIYWLFRVVKVSENEKTNI